MNKQYMIVDGIQVELHGEKNILDVIRKAGIDLPTFCYHSELSVYGACRMCVVEDERGGIIASCSSEPRHKMAIKTNTPKLQKHRKMILELLLSNHCRDCTTCEKNGKCKLQELATRFGIKNVRFPNSNTEPRVDDSSLSIVRDSSKCILCGDCVRMCSEIQHVGAIDFAFRGSKMMVSPAFNIPIATTNCVNCGQCAAVCPTGAITVKNDIPRVWKAVFDKAKRVVVQIAPAVRFALGEEFGLDPGEDVMGKAVAALRRMGFDEIFDTATAADITVMEETREFLGRMEKNESLPLFTSCCPAWIRHAENNHPDLLPNISSCKSPMQMFSSILKEQYKPSTDPENRETVVVAIMPCTAKKYEAARDEFKVDGRPNTDFVLTTQELAKMIREAGIVFAELEPEGVDMPFGMASGAGIIFGVTGGVTEAVLRRVADDKSQNMLRNIAFTGVRGLSGVKEAELELGGVTVKIAVVSGLKNADDLIETVRAGTVQYHLIEVMACPGGCIAGAGQPYVLNREKALRSDGLYKTDRLSQVKRSEENPILMPLYSGLLKGKTKQLLHVHYNQKED
ncbi:MAG: [FeFe] hydrogenase, group A [Bacillota bacterium]